MISNRSLVTRVAGIAALAVASAACWWAWAAGDTTYQVDAVTGTTSGPYAGWQIAGCVLSLIVVTAVAGARLPVWVVVPTVTAAFTAAWAATASSDATGLWAVGAVMVACGTFLGAAFVAGCAVPVRWARRRLEA
ncbi:MAG: hypothetical protein J0I34_32255 [Pseudonocardia sp.]|uniref:hypothetical protein n=1 Tax=unclassified Pseudonocardia TaxID=2619320 RepID=UPI00086E71B8|nr:MULTISPECIES: hypothetical protein [unclassified Pseudonocardia]MBN9113445.1 hypothetical protein [Pseudonocardia sp.]ODU23208.1 MAG: hypothetical protein ABS80_15630 [Pseudonocardia sp. SCN 72-51]ODU99255.1 MAG: hypothetical protein ABT15_32125 [Pseudonocardia sp. SCN 73-27]